MPDEPESGEQFEHQPSAMNGLLVTVLLPAMAIAYLVLRGFAGFSWVEGTMFVAGYLVTAFGITAGYHRLVTHSAYVLSRPARWILIALGSMALQGPIFYWGATHRRHHRHADRAGDPHSPVYGQPRSFPGVVKGLLHAQAGWFLDARLGAWSDSYIPDLICDPQLRLLDKLFRLFAVLSFVIPTVVGALFHRAAVGALDGLFWGGVIRLVAVHQATFSVN